MWKTKTTTGYYTITYCPLCKRQTTFHTVGYNVYMCDICNLKMTYDYKKNGLKL